MQTAEQAKRRIEYVEPVVKNGVRYEELRGAKSRGFGQNGGILVATDDKTGEELWTLQIYETKYDPREEADVQDVFFKELSASWFGSKLTIVNERGKTFVVNIKDRSVTE